MLRTPLIFILILVFGVPDKGITQNAFFKYNNHCLNNLIYFTDESKTEETVVSWFWDFGDDAVSTDAQPIHAYSESGIYSVSLSINTDQGNTYSHVENIEIIAPPFAFFNPTELCDKTVQFSDNSFTRASEVKMWMWDFGDGNYSLDKNPTHQFTDSEHKNVNLKVIDSHGCGDSISQTVKLKTLPETGFDINSVLLSNPAIIQISSHNMNDSVFYLINNELINSKNATIKLDFDKEVEINQKVVDSIGCADSLKQRINLRQQFYVSIPSEFTISSKANLTFDMGTHVFKSLKISNPNHKVIFQQFKPNEFWNGNNLETSDKAISGLYQYVLEFSTKEGIAVTQKGSFTVKNAL